MHIWFQPQAARKLFYLHNHIKQLRSRRNNVHILKSTIGSENPKKCNKNDARETKSLRQPIGSARHGPGMTHGNGCTTALPAFLTSGLATQPACGRTAMIHLRVLSLAPGAFKPFG